MTAHRCPRRIHWGFVPALILLALQGHAVPAWAHEGHAPLPSSGASVDGDQLLLSPSAIRAVGLKLHTVSIGNIRRTLSVNAHVELPPSRRAKVATMMPGRIRAVHVKPGDRVARGAAMASIESLELESLQVTLLKTATELALLEKLAGEQKGLADSGGIAGSVYLKTESTLRKTRAEFEIVKRKLAGWGLDPASIAAVVKTGETVDAVTLTSPIAGFVEHVAVRPGELVQSTDHLFDVVDRSTVFLIGEVLEADAHLVKDGAAATVTFAGLPGKPFSGHIEHQHLHVQQPQRTIQVAVPISNPNGRLRPGMFGRMTITVAEAREEIVCPRSVLIESGNRSFVLRRTDVGKFKLQPVEIGMRSRTQAVIKSGLFPGQQVISRGTYLLASMFDGHKLLRVESGELRVRGRKADVTTTHPPQLSTLNSQLSTPLSAARAIVEIPVGKRAFATSLVEGWIAEIPDHSGHPLHEGVAVKQGQVLARVRSQKLRDMQLELLQANARLQWTRDEVERLKPVARTGGVAAIDFRRQEAELRMLRVEIASLQRRLTLIGLSPRDLKSLLEYDLSRPRKPGKSPGSGRIGNPTYDDPIVDAVEIRSPIAGRISRFTVSPGELVHGNDKLFEIQQTDEVWIKAYFFERDAVRIAVGRNAVVTFPANPSLRLHGKVVRIAPQLASQDRVLPVWIEVANPGHFLKERMLAEVAVGR